MEIRTEPIDRWPGELIVDDDGIFDVYFKRAAKNLHPDLGGSEAQMSRLNAARAMFDDQDLR